MGLKIPNKRASERIFSSFWLVIVILILGVVAMNVGLIYFSDIDIKGDEAEFLYGQIHDCVIENGQVSEEFLERAFDVFAECGLSEESFSKEVFAFRMRLYDGERESLIKEAGGGFPDIDEKCINVNAFEVNANCVKEERIEFYTIEGELNKGYLEIFTASINENE
jgi:hypothetical protein